ncbi:MAG: hypothetical protein J5791_04185 [Fibrobacter sp.]|nr:hypothetical protein [Fibrobacter sp.]
MKKFRLLAGFRSLIVAGSLFAFLLAACSDDDDFSPVSRDRGYDYAYTSTKGLSETPCNEKREGREAVIGRDKDRYECRFDRADSIYIWVGEYDTLTAEGREFSRPESSSSSDEESSDSEGSSSSVRGSSSSEESSSSRYSSSSYSSSRYSSSSLKQDGNSLGLESKEDLFNPDIDYGTMTDPRDGKVYRTVVVNGLTWLAENLNFYDTTDYPLSKRSHCYNDDEKNCELLGRLYARDAVMNDRHCSFGELCDLGLGPVQGICPDGWHIPTKVEVEGLISFVGKNNAREIMSVNGWSSSISPLRDTYGLSFAGEGNVSGTEFVALGWYGHTWIYVASISQNYFVIQGVENYLFLNDYSDKEVYVATRCIKGEGVVPSSSSVSSSSEMSSSSSERFSKMDVEPLLNEQGEQFNPAINYGTMKDSRDGKTYRTVVVNGQTWMAENLNYSGHSIGESFCFNLDTTFCKFYGRLYSRSAAMNSNSCSYLGRCELGNKQIQGVCPSGWHIPSYAEAESLMVFVNKNGAALRSAKGWAQRIDPGLDTYGLSFVAAGAIWPNNNGPDFSYMGTSTDMWLYEQSTNNTGLSIEGSNDKVSIFGFTTFAIHIPVRCISNKAPASSSSAKSSSSSVSSSSVSSSSAKSSSSVSSSSVSSSSEESSSSFDKTVLFNSSLSYGEMTDGRDGKTYKTIDVDGKTWMAENLNFADSSTHPLLKGNNRCYDDDPGECAAFGRLYSREAALNDSKCTCHNEACPSTSGTAQGVCPDGWHIPSKSEAQQLENSVNQSSNKLKSSYGWNGGKAGTNEKGTSFTGTGAYRRENGIGEFKGKGDYTNVWVFDVSNPKDLDYLMVLGGGLVMFANEGESDPFFPIRCVKN